MEFASIQTGNFDIKKPPKAYPDPSPDRDGNYHNQDKDFSKSTTITPGEAGDSHERADTDAAKTSLHHTLGPGHFQSAQGDHIHDGLTTRKLGYGLGLTLTGSKGGNVALGNLITLLKNFVEFTDSTTP